MRQEQQQNMLRNLRSGDMGPQQYQTMLRMQAQQNQQAANGMALNQNDLRHKAAINSNTRNL